jgi:hypothetical protein
LVDKKQRRRRQESAAQVDKDALGAFFSDKDQDAVFEASHEAKEKGNGDKTEIKRNHPDATPQFASPSQLSEHGISFHQPMAPIKSLFGFRVARVVMSEQD